MFRHAVLAEAPMGSATRLTIPGESAGGGAHDHGGEGAGMAGGRGPESGRAGEEESGSATRS